MPEGEAPLVAMEDTSTNGTRWNGSLVRLDAVLLTTNDSINVGGQIFTFEQPESIDKQTGKSKVEYARVEPYKVSDRLIGRQVAFVLVSRLGLGRATVAWLMFARLGAGLCIEERQQTCSWPKIHGLTSKLRPSKFTSRLTQSKLRWLSSNGWTTSARPTDSVPKTC